MERTIELLRVLRSKWSERMVWVVWVDRDFRMERLVRLDRMVRMEWTGTEWTIRNFRMVGSERIQRTKWTLGMVWMERMVRTKWC